MGGANVNAAGEGRRLAPVECEEAAHASQHLGVFSADVGPDKTSIPVTPRPGNTNTLTAYTVQ